MDSPEHIAKQAVIETVDFSGKIGAVQGKSGSVRQQGHGLTSKLIRPLQRIKTTVLSQKESALPSKEYFNA